VETDFETGMVMSFRMHIKTMAMLCIALLAGVGCQASEGQSSRLTQDDLLEASNRMIESLAKSDFLEGRTASSPQAVIVTNKVENLTDQIIAPGEQWSTVLRVQNAMPVQEFSKKYNIKFVVPAEREAMAKGLGMQLASTGGTQPTHTLTATFTSSVRTSDNKGGLVTSRQDYYYLEFKMFEIQSRELIWSDAFEFKRKAQGTVNN
jgi:hypothetical protein